MDFSGKVLSAGRLISLVAELRIGLIGYGGWARAAYVPALRRDGRARIVSAAAPSAATQRCIPEELGEEVMVFDGAAALLDGSAVDAVMVAVPDSAHEGALTTALESGVAVFYEPPLAATRRRIRVMIDRLLQASQITHADLEIGFMPVVIHAAEMVGSGLVGGLQSVHLRLQSSWGTDPESDLSTVDHLAPWYVDTLNRLLDAQPTRVLVLDGHGHPGRNQPHTLAHFDYNGVWGTFQANLGSISTLETVIEVNGDDGDLFIDIFTGKLKWRTHSNPDWTLERVPALEPRAGWPGMHECVSAFLDAVTGGRPSATDARNVAQLHLVGLAAEASKDSGRWEPIELLPD